MVKFVYKNYKTLSLLRIMLAMTGVFLIWQSVSSGDYLKFALVCNGLAWLAFALAPNRLR